VAERAVAPYRDAGEQRSLAPAQKSAATERRVENVPDPAQKPIRGNVAFGSNCDKQARRWPVRSSLNIRHSLTSIAKFLPFAAPCAPRALLRSPPA
jgi:hypothetical protein